MDKLEEAKVIFQKAIKVLSKEELDKLWKFFDGDVMSSESCLDWIEEVECSL